MQELIGAVGKLSPKERKALAVLLKNKGINLFSVAPVFQRHGDEPLLLSYAQERQWFLWQLDPQSTAYHVPAALTLHGELDLTALRQSFQALVQRHESLRTTFVHNGHQALQHVAAEADVQMSVDDLRAARPDPLALKALVESETQRLFDLERGPLLRVRLLRLADEEQVLVLTQHHSVCDGWSMQIMIQELMQAYAAFSQGQQPQFTALTVQYPDYALWQRQWMDAGERQRQLDYWVRQLDGEQAVLELPLDRPRPAERSHAGARLDIPLTSNLVASLRAMAQREGVTLFMLLLASFQTLLHRYSGQASICVGAPTANRSRVETEGLIGYFVNTQVLKADFTVIDSFRALLAQVKQTVLDAQEHQDLPFEQLVEALQPERNLSHSPLFQVMFNHQRDSAGEQSLALGGLRIEQMPLERTTAQFDLTLDTQEGSSGLYASLTYATDLFDASTIARLARHWQQLLASVVAEPGQRIGALALLDAEETAAQLAQWNPNPARFEVGQCLHQLIAAQAAARPEAIALTYQGEHLSYDQLNRRANQWAHRLIELGVGPDVLVGVAVQRSLDMVVGLLAVLKAGGAYLPLDPQYPEDRLAYMIEDSGIELVLSQGEVAGQLPLPATMRCLLLEDAPQGLPDSDPQVATGPDNLAYVIYTSGSTGKPKGTLLAHRNVLRLFSATEHWFGFTGDDVWSLFHSYAFDFSVWELFGALLYGGRVVVVAQDVSRSPEDFYQLLCAEGVTVLNQTPSAFKALMPVACEAASASNALRHVVFGGEALDVYSLRPWFERFGDCQPQLINMYGITETTVHVTYRPISLADLGQAASSPIGEPIADLSWYLLDADLNPVPKGCVGELYVGQAGLARGYLNRAALTATRFVADPFGPAGARLYRTGDLARNRADGVIEYIGRIDHQVKIRGFRIELGEIEARLQQQPEVRDALVLAEDGQLVGYVVTQEVVVSEQQGALRDHLRMALRGHLPDYMVPAHLLFLANWPLTANGKLDRRALPKPDASVLQQDYVAPQSELEQRIAAIWQDVLKLERVGLDDNFFELGGDSIVSIQVVSRARQAGIRFTPKALFQQQTVRGLAQVAEQGVGARVAEQAPSSGSLILLPIHQHFFASAIPERHHWNQSVLLKPTRRLEGSRLEQALQVLVKHHDALRLRFSEQHGQWAARFASVDTAQALLWQVDLDDLQALAAVGDQAQASLDLSNGPLLRAVLATCADGEQRLLLVIHHLAVDGVSWRILADDLQNAYAGHALPARTSSLQHWAARLAEHAQSPSVQGQLGFWQQQLQGLCPDLPQARSGASLSQRMAHSVQTRLDKDLTRQLLQQAPAAYRTRINDLLLTALALVITRWTGQSSMAVQLEGHGREALFDDIDLTRTVGWFTSLYPLRLVPAEGLGASLKAIKEQLRAVPENGLGYGLLCHLGGAPAAAALAGQVMPRITFNYLGQFDAGHDSADTLLLPVGEDGGAERSADAPLDNWLTINGQVYDAELRLGWTFSREMFDIEQMQALADAYGDTLAELVRHCCDGQSSGLTPSDFPLARLTQKQLDQLPLAVSQVEDLYPMAPMQQGMMFHTLFEDAASDYINQMRLDADGLDRERFMQAWHDTLAAHDILRTAFLWEGELAEPLQVVHKQVLMPFQQHDWRGRADLAAALDALAVADREQGFDLARAPLLRMAMVRTGEQSYHLIYTNHHILMDGWSNSRLLGEVLQRYAGQALPPAKVRYSQYIEWLQGQNMAASKAFWGAQLASLEEPTRLVDALPRPGAGRHGQGECLRSLDAAQTARLNAFARDIKVTLNTLVQGAWGLLLQRSTGQDSVCFGATVAGRPADLKGVEEQIGLFINTLPVVVGPSPAQPLDQWLRALQGQNLALREHEHTPLFEIQRWAGQGGEALFDNILVFENYPVAEALQNAAPPGLNFGAIANHEQTNYPLTLAVGLGEHLALHLSYARNLLRDDSVEQMLGQLCRLLLAMAEHGQGAVGDLVQLDAQQIAQTLALGQVAFTCPDPRPLHELFEAQVARQPQATALIHGEQQLSYAQLDARANRLARALVAGGAGPEVLVGVAVERSLEMIVAVLAVLKSGAAYVPLDPEYPAERLQCMMEDSGIRLLLAQTALLPRLPVADAVQVLCLDQDQAWRDADPTPLGRTVHGDNLAYVMFTSGSTGRPKGVGISQSALTRHAWVSVEFFGLRADDCMLQFATFNFDGFVEQLYAPLVCGAAVVLRGPQIWDSETFYEQLISHRISVVDLTTAYWHMLAKDFAAAGPRDYGRLKQVHSGGEAMPAEGLAAWREAGLGHVRLLNTYGPTEATVTVSSHDCSDYVNGLQPLPLTLPIGRVLPERSLMVLDSSAALAAPGVVGELMIGGDLLARGYFQRPGLTAERFLPDPFAQRPGGRMYRSGDLVRNRVDGVIDYVGRVDHQVKIRGLRIELGEIEARLLEQAAVRDAVVLAQESTNGLQLVAYVVADGQAEAALQERLRAHLRQHLPDYMVPGYLLLLEHLPLSPNGKLDRKALPKVDAQAAQAGFVEPRTALQRQVAGIWQEVLGVEQVGLSDRFFALGGHSLLATQVVSRLRHALGMEVALRSLFEHDTLQDFVASLQQPAQDTAPALVPRSEHIQPVLSYAQERQWFLWQLDPHSAAYNVPCALRLRGPLQVEALQQALNALVQRHESLRTTFVADSLQPAPLIAAQSSLAITHHTLPSPSGEAARDAWLEAFLHTHISELFDLSQGPLTRVHLLQLAPDEHILLLVQHHIVTDGASQQVMVNDLVAMYTAFTTAQPLQLAPLALQYADFALWQRQWMDAGERDRQLRYWVERLAGDQAPLALPTDRPRPPVQSHRGARLDLRLPVGLGQALQRLAIEHNVTVYMVLLASFQALLHRYSGQDEVRVGVPVANRSRLETEALVGFLTNTQVLDARFAPRQTFSELLKQVRATALAAQAHQDLPFEQLVEALQPQRSLSHSPLFQVLFNHQREPVQSRAPQRVADLQVETLAWQTHTAQFDLALDTVEASDGLSASLTYATDLFQAATAARIGRHWCNLLQAIIANPAAVVDELPLLDTQERQQALLGWNATATEYPLDTPVQRLIEAQVQRTPQAEALVFGDVRLSYAELDARANQLAHHLVGQGVGPDVLVGIAAERSIEMVVGLLAVLKAGGAYVPLDPELPAERLAYMFEDSGIELLLTQSHLSLPMPAGIKLLALDQLDLSTYPTTNPNITVAPENLAYVIYTSGSTGKPKGAGNRHSALTNRLCWMQQAYGLDNSDTVLQKTPFSFDVSVWEFFWPLMTGARLAVAGPGDHRDPARLVELIQQYQVTTLHFVPSMLQAFLTDAGVSNCTGLKRIVCSGEALPVDAQQQVFAKLPQAGLYNLYGPTEAAIDVTHWTCREEGADTVPIGQPIANLATYVLDSELNPVPTGVIGELYLGGEGLARGYHRRPGLTAERFATSPFGRGERLYRTGDLARQRADGVIEYAGRIDHQVKIRGLRIELGEIEARLMEQPQVREAVVLAVEILGSQQLVAYLVPQQGVDPEGLREVLRGSLLTHLPDYMVPSHWVLLDALPLSPNGKLERKALPRPDVSQAQASYVAPQSQLQQQVANIWQDVLQAERVGLGDNFFELGGHSLLLVTIVSRIQLELGMKLTPQMLFQHPVLGDFVDHLQQSGEQLDDAKLDRLEALFDDMEEV
ncbi:amino acid adenylation domain-containing protein [Pseudomonas farsensis]|uniref:amino acid adenylation domain-containing protein n=1 Tax=Pseudomonas farsensis TaxID=2745492 RepID=UPI003462E96F